MGHIIADENFQQALAGVMEPVEVRTKNGTVLGHYTPAVDPRQAAMHEKYKHIWDLDEADRISATDTGRHTPAEVWEYIRSQATKTT